MLKKILLIVLSMTFLVIGQVPKDMTYEGVLKDNGAPANGNYQLTFRIYDVATGSSALWTETHSSVSVTNGLFKVILGTVDPVSNPLDLSFDERYWIGVEVQTNGELIPRLRLTSSGYSFMSLKADSAENIAANVVNTDNIQNDAVTTAKIDNGTILPEDLSYVPVARPLSPGVSTAEIADNAVTTAKVLPDIVSSVEGVSNDGGNIDLIGNGITIAGDDAANTITFTAQIIGGNTLDMAYDEGGAGVGRTITADAGAVNITGTDGMTISGPVSAGTFSGNGASVTSLNATNLASGTVPNPRLDTDLQDLADGTLTGSKVGTGINANNITTGGLPNARLGGTYSNALTFSNPSNTFYGNGSNITGITGLWDSSGSNIYYSTGNVGIGTTTPSPVSALSIYPGENEVGIYMDHDITTSDLTLGMSIDVDNTHPSGGITYGITSNAFNNGGSSNVYGVHGTANGTSTGNKYGVYGHAAGSGTLWAGYFSGNVYASGNVGIGTTSPSYSLSVSTSSGDRAGSFESSVASPSNHIIHSEYTGVAGNYDLQAVYGDGNSNPGYGYGGTFYGGYRGVCGYNNADTYTSSSIGVFGSSVGAGGPRYGVYGATGSGTTRYGVYASGNLGYSGSLIGPSDRKLKENERALSSILPQLMRLQVKSYTHSTNIDYEHMNLAPGKHYGLIAQDLEQVFPDLVVDAVHPGKTNEDTGRDEEDIHYKGVNSIELIPLLIQGMKEQQQIIEELKQRIDKLEN